MTGSTNQFIHFKPTNTLSKIHPKNYNNSPPISKSWLRTWNSYSLHFTTARASSLLRDLEEGCREGSALASWDEAFFLVFAFKFVFLTSRLRHLLVVHTLLRKIMDLSLKLNSASLLCTWLMEGNGCETRQSPFCSLFSVGLDHAQKSNCLLLTYNRN